MGKNDGINAYLQSLQGARSSQMNGVQRLKSKYNLCIGLWVSSLLLFYNRIFKSTGIILFSMRSRENLNTVFTGSRIRQMILGTFKNVAPLSLPAFFGKNINAKGSCAKISFSRGTQKALDLSNSCVSFRRGSIQSVWIQKQIYDHSYFKNYLQKI